MKRECEIARDLMPLCVDEAASEGSQEFVAAHAAVCKECAQVYRQMRDALAGQQTPDQLRAGSERAAQRIRRHLRARTMRNVLLGLMIGLIIAACGLWGYNRIAVTWSRPMATDRYEMSAYSRPDGSLILVLRAPGSNGYTSWVEEDGGSILYVAAHQPALPRRKVAGGGVWLLPDFSGKPLSGFVEIRQGTPDDYRTVWTRPPAPENSRPTCATRRSSAAAPSCRTETSATRWARSGRARRPSRARRRSGTRCSRRVRACGKPCPSFSRTLAPPRGTKWGPGGSDRAAGALCARQRQTTAR